MYYYGAITLINLTNKYCKNNKSYGEFLHSSFGNIGIYVLIIYNYDRRKVWSVHDCFSLDWYLHYLSNSLPYVLSRIVLQKIGITIILLI